MLEQFLKELCEGFPFTKGEKSEEGFYPLRIDKLTIEVKEIENRYFFRSVVLPIPSIIEKETLFMHVAKGNYFGQGTGGSVLGIDKEGKQFLLTLRTNPDLNFRFFKESLEDFANYIEFWQREIQKKIENK